MRTGSLLGVWRIVASLWIVTHALSAQADEIAGSERDSHATTASISGSGEAANLVTSVRFVGLKRVDPDAIRLVMLSRLQSVFSAALVSDDIRAIYATGYVDDVRVFREPGPGGGIGLVVEVAEKPSVRRVDVLGNDDVSTEDIKNVVDIKPFTIFNDAKVAKNVQKIKELYLNKGYYLADVHARTDISAAGEVTIAFEIDENAKVEVRSVKFVGNQNLGTDLLKSGMITREGSLMSIVSDEGTYRAEAFQVDLVRISSHYFDRGYINVKIDPPDLELSPDKRYLSITLRIEEGEQYRIGKLGFSGDLLTTQDVLLARIQSKSGEVFNRSMLGQDLLALKTEYEDEGFAYANINPQTHIDPDKRIIDLVFDIQKGQKVYYERINIVGNTKTQDKVIRRELRIYEGELTSATLRETSRRRVAQLGYFEKVEMKAKKGSSENLQIVDIEVKERATGTFQLGAGLSTGENFIVTAQIAQDNFLGRGHSIGVSASISGLQQQFNLNFTEPYFLDSPFSLGLAAFNQLTRYNNFVRDSKGGNITIGYPILEDFRASLTYSLEFVESRGEEGLVSTQPALAALNDRGRISSLRFSLSYDTRDNRLFPNDGMYHLISAEVSNPAFGSTESRQFERYRAYARFYKPLVWILVGKLSFRGGYMHSSSERGLSPAEKFILGGIYSIRGFNQFSIGADDVATLDDRGVNLYNPYSSTFAYTAGGNKEFLMNAEIEFPIFEELGIKGVFFLDAGNVFAEDENFFYLGSKAGHISQISPPFDFDPKSLPLGLYWSVGFGFRWFSPIGPLRFEWGIPLTARPDDRRGPNFEFSIGNAF